jgi:hypothetical protein
MVIGTKGQADIRRHLDVITVEVKKHFQPIRSRPVYSDQTKE